MLALWSEKMKHFNKKNGSFWIWWQQHYLKRLVSLPLCSIPSLFCMSGNMLKTSCWAFCLSERRWWCFWIIFTHDSFAWQSPNLNLWVESLNTEALSPRRDFPDGVRPVFNELSVGQKSRHPILVFDLVPFDIMFCRLYSVFKILDWGILFWNYSTICTHFGERPCHLYFFGLFLKPFKRSNHVIYMFP